jgi:ketosteroid isomerase-like protein
MKKLTARPRLLLMLLLSLLAGGAGAQTQPAQPPPAPRDELFRRIAALDAEAFDAFNRCDLEKLGSFFTEELEFYHDNGGLTNRTRQSLVESVKNNICGKVYRVLVPETLEVYPMHGFGAVETGVHRFYHPGRDSTEQVGEARFVHLWQEKDGAWKITRVISYDHHPVAK